jgi:type IV secretion system protein VirB5
MKLKRLLLSIAAVAVMATKASAQGIPVIDVANLAQAIQQVTAWSNQYSQMVQQYQMLTNQLTAITGTRGLGEILNAAGLRQQLPADFVGQFEQLRSLGFAGASPAATAIYQSISTFNCASQFPNDQKGRLSCEATALVVPTNISLINTSIASSQDRVRQLQGLMSHINAADDAKAAADLSNRITVEMAMLQNEKMMMDMALAQQQAQAKLLEQQKTEAGLKRVTSTTGTNPFSLQSPSH